MSNNEDDPSWGIVKPRHSTGVGKVLLSICVVGAIIFALSNAQTKNNEPDAKVIGATKADIHQKAEQREKLCADIKSSRPYGFTSDDDGTTRAIVQYCSEYFKAVGVKYPKD